MHDFTKNFRSFSTTPSSSLQDMARTALIIGDQAQEGATAEALVAPSTIFAGSRRLLENPTPPETVTQYCYPSGGCDLSNLHEGILGFVLQGDMADDGVPNSVSSAGDINGDSFDDVLVGAPNAYLVGRPGAGKTYVVFGSNQTNTWGSGALDLSSLMDGLRGFVLQGESNDDYSGYSVSSAGDINGDGLMDILVGAPSADPPGQANAGKTYVVFGTNQTNAWGSGILDLTSLMDGQRGFVLQGEAADDGSGFSVSSAGDINSDGLADILIGAPYASVVGRINAGKVYIVFGSDQINVWGSGILNLSSMIDGQRGFVLQGEVADDRSGYSVSGAGDINGDSFTDLLIGAPGYAVGISAGKTYVVFGSNQTNVWDLGILNLTSLTDGQQGFVLQGKAAGDWSGYSVSGAGDINGDGFADVLMGTPNAQPAGSYSGKSYLIFGSNQTNAWGSGVLDLSSLMNGQRGVALIGSSNDYSGSSVSSAGDINGDGLADMLVGGSNSNADDRVHAGKTYVVFGSNQTDAWGAGVFYLSSLMNGQRGFALKGEASNDYSGYPVSYAGDINGDTLADMLIGANGAGPGGRAFAGQAYVLLGAALRFAANNLRLAAGETIRLNDSMLAFNGVKISVEMLEHGSFTAVNAPNIPLNFFYSQNVSDGQIQFIHDGSPLAPAYRLSSRTNLYYSYSDAQIDFLGSPPALVNNQLFVDQGLATTLQSGDLSASDRDGALGDLLFILNNVQHGRFNHYNASGQLIAANISQFSQQAVFDRQIQFLHDGSNTAPSYEVAVSDSHSVTSSRTAAITFNHAPVLTLNPMIIDQGQATRIQSSGLSATDYETFSSNLVFIANNITHGQFEFISNSDSAITEIVQIQVFIGNVQFAHDGSDSVPSFGFTVSDGRITTAAQNATILLNRAPQLLTNQLSVQQGVTQLLSSNHLNATDVLGTPTSITTASSSLIFEMKEISHGRFELVTNPTVAITSFTQQQLTTNQVQFVPDGNQIAPSYAVSVSDGRISTAAEPANITFNARPVFQKNQLTIAEGETVLLTPTHLNATDIETPANNLTFTVSNVQHGTFFSISQNTTVNSFLQRHITQGDLQFTHDGGEIPPSYSVSVSDGVLSAGPIAAIISFTPVNDPPTMVNNRMSIVGGQTITLSDNEMSATDPDNALSSLVFSVSNIQHGKFVYAGQPNVPITVFSQAKIDTADVQFIADKSGQTPAYTVTVTDADGASSMLSQAQVTFTPSTEVGTTTSTAVRNAIIGGVASGGVGLLFFFFQLYVQYRANKAMEEGEGVAKEQLEYYKNVIRPISKKIFERIKLSGCLGYISEETVKDTIAAITVLVNEIEKQGIEVDLRKLGGAERSRLIDTVAKQAKRLLVPKAGCCSISHFFKPETTAAKIEEHAEKIALAVKVALGTRTSVISPSSAEGDDLEGQGQPGIEMQTLNQIHLEHPEGTIMEDEKGSRLQRVKAPRDDMTSAQTLHGSNSPGIFGSSSPAVNQEAVSQELVLFKQEITNQLQSLNQRIGQLEAKPLMVGFSSSSE